MTYIILSLLFFLIVFSSLFLFFYEIYTKPDTFNVATVFLLGIGMSWIYVFYSSLFGDGFFEFAKHCYLIGSLTLSGIIVLFCVIFVQNIPSYLYEI